MQVDLLDTLVGVVTWEGWMNVWSVMNTPFFTTLMLVIGGLFAERRFRENSQANSAKDSAERKAGSKSSRLESQANDIYAKAPEKNGNPDPFREQARSAANNISGFLRKLGSMDTDGRHRRVYDRLSKNPKGLLVALTEREQLETGLSDQIFQALALWDGFARGRASNKIVPQEVSEQLAEAEKLLQSIVQPVTANQAA